MLKRQYVSLAPSKVCSFISHDRLGSTRLSDAEMPCQGATLGHAQKALGGRGGNAFASSAMLYAFDQLYLDGQDPRARPLDERRAMLEWLIGKQSSSIRLSEEVNAHGADFLKLACQMGLEGIIAKRRDAPYRSGRGGDWLKIKCIQSETFLIVGYEPSPAALGGIGRLLLAATKDDALTYVGGVGTGFTHKTGSALKRQLDKLVIDKPAVAIKPKGVVWTQPILPAEIEFRGWTTDAQLRHSSYKGLREDADRGDIFEMADGE